MGLSSYEVVAGFGHKLRPSYPPEHPVHWPRTVRWRRWTRTPVTGRGTVPCPFVAELSILVGRKNQGATTHPTIRRSSSCFPSASTLPRPLRPNSPKAEVDSPEPALHRPNFSNSMLGEEVIRINIIFLSCRSGDSAGQRGRACKWFRLCSRAFGR